MSTWLQLEIEKITVAGYEPANQNGVHRLCQRHECRDVGRVLPIYDWSNQPNQ